MSEITDIQNILKEAQQFMTCQTEHPDLAMLTKKLKPGTLYRFRFACPWKYYLVLRYGTTDKVPAGFSKQTIVFIGPKHGVREMPLFRFKQFYSDFNEDIEIIQCL